MSQYSPRSGSYTLWLIGYTYSGVQMSESSPIPQTLSTFYSGSAAAYVGCKWLNQSGRTYHVLDEVGHVGETEDSVVDLFQRVGESSQPHGIYSMGPLLTVVLCACPAYIYNIWGTSVEACVARAQHNSFSIELTSLS